MGPLLGGSSIVYEEDQSLDVPKQPLKRSPLFPPNTLILLSRYFYTAGGCRFLIIDP